MANTFYYGSCNSTAESTVKQVVIQGLPAEIRDESFLRFGDMISVTFTYGNSAETPTLRVDGSSTGTAKTIVINTSATATSSGNGTTFNTWGANEAVLFTYNGSYWVNNGSSRSLYNAYSVSDVYISRYGTDTYGNILAAHTAKKAIFCEYIIDEGQGYSTTYWIPLMYFSDFNTEFYFGYVKDSTFTYYKINFGGVWSTGTTALQTKITANGLLQGDGAGNITAVGTTSATTLSIDSAPTASSSNLVTSGGVYTALQSAGGMFMATYNTTTGGAISDAYTAGKTILMKDSNNNIYQLSYGDTGNPSSFTFDCVKGDIKYSTDVMLDSGTTTWSSITTSNLKPTSVSATLSSSGWSSSTGDIGYQGQIVSVNGVTSTNEIEVSLDVSSASYTQYAEAVKCQLLATSQGTNQIIVECMADYTPTTNIPIVVRIF